jgi:hypothetical protein
VLISLTSMRYLLLVIVLSFFGCSTAVPPVLPAAMARISEQSASWHSIKIRAHWPEAKDPSWGIDALLANEVFAPVVRLYAANVIWRFHRRALRDTAGHVFSFHYFGSPEVAKNISSMVADTKLLLALKERLIIEEVWFEDNGGQFQSEADPSWSPEMRAAWPYFIMGVSAAWLDLVQQHFRKADPKDTSISALLSAYRDADRAVSAVWAKEGQHAFLHHLSGLFGYSPIEIRRSVQF